MKDFMLVFSAWLFLWIITTGWGRIRLGEWLPGLYAMATTVLVAMVAAIFYWIDWATQP